MLLELLVPSLVSGAVDLLKDSPVESVASAKAVVTAATVSLDVLIAEVVLRLIPTKYRTGVFAAISALSKVIDEKGDKLLKQNLKKK